MHFARSRSLRPKRCLPLQIIDYILQRVAAKTGAINKRRQAEEVNDSSCRENIPPTSDASMYDGKREN